MNIKELKKIKIPNSPGVYFFLNKSKKPIYIGKATSLKSRVLSYFAGDIAEKRSPLIEKMVEETKSIDFKETQSVLEAMMLEADLIKKFKPKFNTKEKDDKSFYCIVLTKEDFPVIKLVRKKDLDFTNSLLINYSSKLLTTYGPFGNPTQLKEALKIIRKVFPWRDEKCKDDLGRPCFNFSLGLCPGVCAGKVSKKEYGETIKKLKKIFSGKIKDLVDELEKEMSDLAKKEMFEKANMVKKQIYSLKHINDVSLIKKDIDFKKDSFRIECFDVAHFSGKEMVGVFSVVEDSSANKNEYRKFNIKGITSSNDTGALKQIIKRRFRHREWKFPNLLVVDGGMGQVNIAKKTLAELKINIPVVSVVKDEHHKPRGFFGEEEFIKKYKREIILANSEAHRFAIAFHRKKRVKNFIIK